MKRNEIRIIGGKWRSRRIYFVDSPGLRPTPDRIRETLFNWLAPYISGSRCLDLFTGSGALGLEALSREAFEVIAIDSNPTAIQALKKNIQALKADQIQAIEANALAWIEKPGSPFDIVFLDPPYADNLLRPCFSLLEANNWVTTASFIYFESSTPVDPDLLPKTWHLFREKKAGNVYYYLAQKLF